jgi:hypothetical protein
MLSLNHGLTGILLGAYLPLPVAIPAALASHFVMDALPHYGIDQASRNTSRTYKLIVVSDTFLALSFAAALIPLHKWNMEITGWVAYSPDALWVLYYFRNGRSLHIIPNNRFLRFHQRIQRWERPWGIIVELIFLAVLLPLVLKQMLT